MPAKEKTSKRRTKVNDIPEEAKDLLPNDLKRVQGGDMFGAANGLSQANQGQSLQNQINQNANTGNPNIKPGGPF